MKSLRHAWFIAVKDIKIFTRDRAAVFFFIVFPFMFIIMFNFLLAGVGSEDERLELHLVTREPPGGLSHQILGAMETKDEALLGPGEPAIIWDEDYDAARQAFEKGLTDYLNVLDAERTYVNTERQYVNSLADYHKAVAAIEGLIGQSITDITTFLFQN